MTDGTRTEPNAEQVRQRNRDLFAGWFGPIYSFYMEHEPLSRVIARTVWGTDISAYYASMRAIGEVPDDGAIVDAPCGAGVALRGLRPDQQVRYLAFDISPAMLERARRRARRRGLSQVSFAEADAESLPVDDSSVDLFLCYWGLHCFANPRAAVAEAGRCLRPGGRLVGAAIVRGRDLRQHLLVRPDHGAFGAVPSAAELRTWLDSGFEEVEESRSGAAVYFEARAPRYPQPR